MNRSRTPLVIVAVLVVVAVAGLLAVVLTRNADDDSTDATDATSSLTPTTAVPGAADTGSTTTGGAAATDIVYGAVEVAGEPLPAFGDEGDDPAVGMPAPAVSGTTYGGDPIEVLPGQGGPMMLVFLAHWCPHCNAEIPVLNEWRDSGAVPADLQVVGVSTAVTDERPNFPPSQWLGERGWTWPAMADDDAGSAFVAYGGTVFPYFVVIDAAGTVRARNAGELPVDQLTTLVTTALA